MGRAVAVGDRELLTQGVYGDRLFFGEAADACRWIRVPDFLDQVIGIEATAAACGNSKDPFGCLLTTGRQCHRQRGSSHRIVGKIGGLVGRVGYRAVGVLRAESRWGDCAHWIFTESEMKTPKHSQRGRKSSFLVFSTEVRCFWNEHLLVQSLLWINVEQRNRAGKRVKPLNRNMYSTWFGISPIKGQVGKY